MRKTCRLTSLLLALMWLFTCLPFGILAEESIIVDDTEESFSEDFGAAPEMEEPVVEPSEEPAVEPPVEPTEEPAVEPTDEPVEEPVVEPSVEPIIEPTPEPVTEPSPAPTEASVVDKAEFVAGLARISGGLRLYEHKGLWGAYVETLSGGVVYAAEQSEDEKAIRIVLNNGEILWDGWVAASAVRMLTDEETADWDAQERTDENILTHRGHELLPIRTVSSEPTPTPAPTEPPVDSQPDVPVLTPEPEVTDEPDSTPEIPDESDIPVIEDEIEDEEEIFSETLPEETVEPLPDPVIDSTEVAQSGNFVEYRALNAPSNLSASHNRNGLMTLRWQGTEDAEAYQVMAKAANETEYRLLATVYGTSYTTDALDPTVVYYFRVRSVTLTSTGSVINASPYSTSYPYIVLGDATINDPRGKDTTTIRLTWKAVEGATHYDVIMSIHGANQWYTARTDLVTDYCDITNLSFDETYDFRVIPKRKLANGTVITGNSSRVIMVGSPMETPSFQKYEWTENGVRLTWDAIPGASGYVIYRRAFSDPDVTNYEKLVVFDTPVTSYVDTTMAPGEVYYYFVYSFKLCSPEGWRCFSLKGEIGMGVWLQQADGLTATDYDEKNVYLSWPAVTGANAYDVYATKTASSMPAADSGSRVSGTSVYHQSAVIGTTYYYFVRPVRVFSNGDISMGPWSMRLSHTHADANVTYRALLIGNTYPNEDNFLPGCDNDAYAMQDMLSRMTGTPYNITLQLNLSDTRMINAIRTTFADADANDVSLFYYSGHGANSPDTGFHGALVGVYHTYLSVSRLKEELDKIPGKKIVILDSCHSGAMIGKSAGEEVTSAELSAFNSLVISTFASDADVVVKTVDIAPLADEDELFGEQPLMIARGENDLANSGYYVITAAHSSEQSVSMGYDDDGDNKVEKYFGLFTYGVCHGSGWNVATDKVISTLNADRDGNNEITLYEAYLYAKATAQRSNPNQTAQIWPSNSAQVVWAK